MLGYAPLQRHLLYAGETVHRNDSPTYYLSRTLQQKYASGVSPIIFCHSWQKHKQRKTHIFI